MFDFLWNLASFVIALGILVTVHEYGHFWVARKNGIKVLRFSVGFGKPIWRTVDKHGTEYVVALIPLGGYVKMLDERVDDVAPEDKDVTFNSKSVYQRIAVVAAGPMANFIFAIFAFYLMFLIGVPSVKPIVGPAEPNSIFAQADIPERSEIVSIAGQRTRDWQDVNLALVGQIGSDEIAFKVQLPDSQYQKSYVFDTRQWNYQPENESSLSSLGIKPYQTKTTPELVAVGKGSPAEKGGLLVGDKVVAFNGIAIGDDWQLLSNSIKQFADEEVLFTIERNQGSMVEQITIPVKLGSRTVSGKKQGYLGVSPKSEPYPKAYLIDLSYGPLDAIPQALSKTWQLITLSFDMIGKLITGDVSVNNLSGPISIAQGAGSSAGYGVVYFLSFLALISINLGIINLLPLPVLDGGHLLYYLIELSTGKPVPEKIQEMGFRFGALILLALMSIAIVNDISRL